MQTLQFLTPTRLARIVTARSRRRGLSQLLSDENGTVPFGSDENGSAALVESDGNETAASVPAARENQNIGFASKGFTLVELLVVIAIISILAGLITGAAILVRGRAIIASIVTDVKQLEAACENYKSKFGEYPPDFAAVNDLDSSGNPTAVGLAARAAVLRHLAKAFPRYVPGVSTASTADDGTWAGFVADLQNAANPTIGWKMNLGTTGTGANPYFLSPAGALTFWLGGMPDWLIDNTIGTVQLASGEKIVPTNPVRGFRGFSADPTDPFDAKPGLTAPSASRTTPFYDFNVNCVGVVVVPAASGATRPVGLGLWPTRACDKGYYPLVYFRANNGTYFAEGSTTAIKNMPYYDATATPPWQPLVCPAIDTRLSTIATGTLSWVNPQSVQIFSSGRDLTYGILGTTTFGGGITGNVLQFPTGENYTNTSASAPNKTYTYDDITNFSEGTLEDRIP